MSERVFLANTSDCAPGSSLEVTINGRIIALFNMDGEFYALDGICPHQGGPLGKGTLCDGVVTCPWHQWQFHVKSGDCLISPAIQQPTIELELAENQVFAKL